MPGVLEQDLDAALARTGADLRVVALARDLARLRARMVVDGSVHVRDIVAGGGARRLLQLSSGSVYGAHFVPAPPIAEGDPGVPDGSDGASRLALAKLEDERRLLVSSPPDLPAIMIARGFALCGPWLPLDYSFAFGNFVGAALRRKPIRVTGDGTPQRNFLYRCQRPGCLALDHPERGSGGRAYDVGSEHAISVGDLASRVAARLGGTVQVGGTRRTRQRGCKGEPMAEIARNMLRDRT